MFAAEEKDVEFVLEACLFSTGPREGCRVCCPNVGIAPFLLLPVVAGKFKDVDDSCLTGNGAPTLWVVEDDGSEFGVIDEF